MVDSNAANLNYPRWFDWATRSTAVLAVLAALSSGRWGASNLQAILEQGKVNDTWAWFQAARIKAHEADDMAKLLDALKQDVQPERMEKFEKARQGFLDEAKRENDKRDTLQLEAAKYEDRRNHMVERGFWFEISFTALQLGVILCTISTAARKKTPWQAGLAIGVLGLIILANGFRLFVRAPQAWYMSTSEAMSK